jgi:hypothetical protein
LSDLHNEAGNGQQERLEPAGVYWEASRGVNWTLV